MPAFAASLDAARIDDLVGYVRTLKAGASASGSPVASSTRSSTASSTTSGAIAIPASVFGTALVKRNAAQEQRDWPAWGGASGNNHYSSLAQINRNNVKQLTQAWSFDSREEGGLQQAP